MSNTAPNIDKINTKRVMEQIEAVTPGENRVVTLLQGTITEPEREYRKPLHLSGTLAAPYDFYRHRLKKHGKHDVRTAHLLIDKAVGMMVLVVDEDDLKSIPRCTVTGLLEANPDLTAMGINDNRTWNVKELMQHLKFNRAMFTERGRCMDIVSNLMNFTLNVDKEIKNHDDLRGNVLVSIEQKIRQQINLDFDVTCPVFKGTPNQTFGVTVGVTVTSTGCEFWLESVDLRELQQRARATAIDDEVAKFADEIVVIETTGNK
jgi:hypothetical protein